MWSYKLNACSLSVPWFGKFRAVMAQVMRTAVSTRWKVKWNNVSSCIRSQVFESFSCTTEGAVDSNIVQRLSDKDVYAMAYKEDWFEILGIALLWIIWRFRSPFLSNTDNRHIRRFWHPLLSPDNHLHAWKFCSWFLPQVSHLHK